MVLVPRTGEAVVDLESGLITGDEAGSPNPCSGDKMADTFVTKFCYGEKMVKLSVNFSNSSEASSENVKQEGKSCGDLTEKKMRKEKRKSTSAKKPPKPPRGPRALSLDAADQKLINEIAEVAMMKRARIERMKALKKMKTAKSSSSNGSLFAMLFTVLVCLVILVQGLSSRSSGVSFHSSSDPGQATVGLRLIPENLNPAATVAVSTGSLNPGGSNSGPDFASKAIMETR